MRIFFINFSLKTPTQIYFILSIQKSIFYLTSLEMNVKIYKGEKEILNAFSACPGNVNLTWGCVLGYAPTPSCRCPVCFPNIPNPWEPCSTLVVHLTFFVYSEGNHNWWFLKDLVRIVPLLWSTSLCVVHILVLLSPS